jgi:hypothetical protein
MSQQQLDVQGEAREALRSAVASYGQRVLNDPHILGNLVADLLPDLPRERSLLTAGAEAGIAAEMMRYVHNQHIDPDTAVQLAARTLAERRAIDPDASMWVASEYAQALGFQVRPYSQALQPGMPDGSPAPTTAPVQSTSASQPTTAAPVSPQVPPMPQPQAPQAQSWPPQGPPGPGPQEQYWPPAQPAPAGPPASGGRRKRGIIAAATAVALVAAYLIVAAVAHTVPFGKSHPVALTTPTAKPTHPATPKPKPSPPPSLAAGVTPLLQLLPQDISDPTTQCQALKKPYKWRMPGLVTALSCSDPNLPNGYLDAYQMDSRADFETSWRDFNTWWNFDTSSAQTACPPSSAAAQGLVPWNGKGFPSMQGQVLECETITGDAPVYVWTLPTQDMWFIAVGANGSSMKALNSWWESGNSGPAVIPTPPPSSSAS